METKNKKAADKAETSKTRELGEIYINCIEKNDSYMSYKTWWTHEMFLEVDASVDILQYNAYMTSPYTVPLRFRDNLLERGREEFLKNFVEENSYYRMLMGLPPIDASEDDYIYLSDELQEAYGVSSDIPVHQLSLYDQNLYIHTDEYEEILKNNEDKSYLKYLGNMKIDVYRARKAKDFDIIRYPKDKNEINPVLLRKFSEMYANYREYVMVVLYNSQFEDMYVGYREFMGFIIVAYVLLQIGNNAVEEAHQYQFMDDTIIYTLFSLYNIPDKIVLPKENRRYLANGLLKLIREKGTTESYYDLVQILGYEDVIINKLMLMRGDVFDENGTATGETNPYFVAINLLDSNPYKTISSGNAKVYTYEEITKGDPMWWETEDVTRKVTQSNYSMSDSKYITIEAMIHQMESMFESLYFSRLVMDNKNECSDYKLEISSLFGSHLVSVYDTVLGLICATCLTNGLSGDIFTDDALLATAGFNFELDIDLLQEWLETTSYIDSERVLTFFEDIAITTVDDISRIMTNVIYPLRRWIENKIVNAENKQEYIEYEALYRAIFTYDASRNKFLDDFIPPMDIIQDKHLLSDDTLDALKHVFPRTLTGDAVTVEMFNSTTNSTRYHYPFLSLTKQVPWFIHIVVETNGLVQDRGYLYFHDVLNCKDVRELTNMEGKKIFMDRITGVWRINQDVVDRAIAMINDIPSSSLDDLYFQIYTNNADDAYNAGEKLPTNVTGLMIKNILIDKITMDCEGLCLQADNYFELLRRSDIEMYNLICADKRYRKRTEEWRNDINILITALENELDLHMKYYEQSVLGNEMFFNPLITLIKRFKSNLVDIARVDSKIIFSDKVDVGGNSNMLKLFDSVAVKHEFSIDKRSNYASKVGLYDTTHKVKHRMSLNDRSEVYTTTEGSGFSARTRTTRMGSMRMCDDMIFFKNGKPLDSIGHKSMWYNGEYEDGRWSQDEDVLFRTRDSLEHVTRPQPDLEAWKDYVESYNPDE